MSVTIFTPKWRVVQARKQSLLILQFLHDNYGSKRDFSEKRSAFRRSRRETARAFNKQPVRSLLPVLVAFLRIRRAEGRAHGEDFPFSERDIENLTDIPSTMQIYKCKNLERFIMPIVAFCSAVIIMSSRIGVPICDSHESGAWSSMCIFGLYHVPSHENIDLYRWAYPDSTTDFATLGRGPNFENPNVDFGTLFHKGSLGSFFPRGGSRPTSGAVRSGARSSAFLLTSTDDDDSTDLRRGVKRPLSSAGHTARGRESRLKFLSNDSVLDSPRSDNPPPSFDSVLDSPRADAPRSFDSVLDSPRSDDARPPRKQRRLLSAEEKTQAIDLVSPARTKPDDKSNESAATLSRDVTRSSLPRPIQDKAGLLDQRAQLLGPPLRPSGARLSLTAARPRPSPPSQPLRTIQVQPPKKPPRAQMSSTLGLRPTSFRAQQANPFAPSQPPRPGPRPPLPPPPRPPSRPPPRPAHPDLPPPRAQTHAVRPPPPPPPITSPRPQLPRRIPKKTDAPPSPASPAPDSEDEGDGRVVANLWVLYDVVGNLKTYVWGPQSNDTAARSQLAKDFDEALAAVKRDEPSHRQSSRGAPVRTAVSSSRSSSQIVTSQDF